MSHTYHWLAMLNESISAVLAITTSVTVAWSVRPSVCHTLDPAKPVVWNEMPFDRKTRVSPSSIVLDRGPGYVRFCGRNLPSKFAPKLLGATSISNCAFYLITFVLV